MWLPLEFPQPLTVCGWGEVFTNSLFVGRDFYWQPVGEETFSLTACGWGDLFTDSLCGVGVLTYCQWVCCSKVAFYHSLWCITVPMLILQTQINTIKAVWSTRKLCVGSGSVQLHVGVWLDHRPGLLEHEISSVTIQSIQAMIKQLELCGHCKPGPGYSWISS